MLSRFQTRSCLPGLNQRNCRSEAEQRRLPIAQSWQGPGRLRALAPRVALPPEMVKETAWEGNKTRVVLCFKGK